MIWHIFKKDARLLWPMAALVAAVHLVNAGLLARGRQFSRLPISGMADFGWVSNNALPLVSLLGLAALAIALIQQDRLPGTTQDWLTRPIRKSRLYTAKLLFILLLGLGPILVGDLWMGAAEHLRTVDVVDASLTRSGVLFCLVCIPAVMIGAVTESLAGALIFALAVTVFSVIELIVFSNLKTSILLMQSPFAWTSVLVLIIANVAAVIVLLPLQLRWRSTNRVRWIVAAYFCLLPAVAFLPLHWAFKIQQALSHQVPAAVFTPEIDASRGIVFSFGDERMPAALRKVTVTTTVGVPVIVPERKKDDEPWQIDQARLRTIGGSQDRLIGFSNAYISLRRRPGSSNRLIFNLPTELFQSLRERHAKIEAQLYITTFKLAAKKPIHSLQDGALDEFSRCDERASHMGMFVNCVSTRPVGACMEFDDTDHAVRDTSRNAFVCRQPAYEPWPLPLWRDPYYSVVVGRAAELRTVLMSGAQETAKADPIVSNYVPESHFTRTIVFELDAATEGSLNEVFKSIDGPGAAARFVAPAAMAADRHGNLFIVDGDEVVRKVTPAGDVTTVAGASGEAGLADGPAANARFKEPRGIAVDSADNIYVADTGNHLIRKISSAGIVSTVAGGAKDTRQSASSVLHDPADITCTTDGTLYVIDRNENNKPVLLRITPDGAVSKVAGPDVE